MTAYGASRGELADLGSRLVAIIIDGIILAVIGWLIGLILSNSGLGWGASFLLGVAYNAYFWTQNNGQTPGKKLMNIRVVKVDGSPLQIGDAVIRYIGYYINSFVFAIGWIWALFDENKQGWHDKLASTLVVRA